MIYSYQFHNVTLEHISFIVFSLVVMAGLISDAVLWFTRDRVTFLFTNDRLIVKNSAPGVSPQSVAYHQITLLAVHVNHPDTRPEEVRIAEYVDRFNHPEHWPKRGSLREWARLGPPPPDNGIIRLYGPDDLHAVIMCAGSLRPRVEAIRHLLGLNVAIQ
jgi:hypothetical protein